MDLESPSKKLYERSRPPAASSSAMITDDGFIIFEIAYALERRWCDPVCDILNLYYPAASPGTLLNFAIFRHDKFAKWGQVDIRDRLDSNVSLTAISITL
ncbi:hypothetical protein DBV15_01877 [Temnothorax longispinosus]|uniref:Uncharacterized protein n=1 Tax=Temnothorax longispinosus TaxID=300112 RepID=A0A4S2KV55_9HYME|nr:hypothetical protein DBV15_01877 [Temnothorax longispinosus]